MFFRSGPAFPTKSRVGSPDDIEAAQRQVRRHGERLGTF